MVEINIFDSSVFIKNILYEEYLDKIVLNVITVL